MLVIKRSRHSTFVQWANIAFAANSGSQLKPAMLIVQPRKIASTIDDLGCREHKSPKRHPESETHRINIAWMVDVPESTVPRASLVPGIVLDF